MKRKAVIIITLILSISATMLLGAGGGGHEPNEGTIALPMKLAEYEKKELAEGVDGLLATLIFRVKETPFNIVASLIFLFAITHTFMSGFFRDLAHKLEEKHFKEIQEKGLTADAKPFRNAKDDSSFSATLCHFLGEIEAIFGIWCLPLIGSIFYFYGWDSVTYYIDNVVNYTEPMFVVIIMAIASTRPVLKFSEQVLGKFANFGGQSPKAWWYSILIIAPLLGSFVTEPAAITIAALLLVHQIYRYDPSPLFKYGTLGLLFVNISVGGTLTHFAAPPVLMVAGTWGWDLPFMLLHFGWKATIGIVVATLVYGFVLRKEFAALAARAQVMKEKEASSGTEEPVPFWITGVILLFMAWTVFNLHNPPLFIAGFLFFLAFVQATNTHQDDVSIKGPLLVGFFLAGLVTHGPLQQWWIAPVLSSLGEIPLFVGSVVLTAFNDNAAITFLASQVPAFDPAIGGSTAHIMQYAVVAGAVTGGGLTVIANAPNPAGQSILQKHFENGVSPIKLLIAALFPTIVMALCFMLFKHI